MIYSLKDDAGRIYAYIEGIVTDKEGRLDNEGQYLFIQDAWIHPDYRNNKLLNALITGLFHHPIMQKVEFAFWGRKKSGKEIGGLIPVSRFIKYIL